MFYVLTHLIAVLAIALLQYSLFMDMFKRLVNAYTKDIKTLLQDNIPEIRIQLYLSGMWIMDEENNLAYAYCQVGDKIIFQQKEYKVSKKVVTGSIIRVYID